MNKISIKVIKRKDAEVMTRVKTRSTYGTKSTTAFSEEKIECRLHRKMADTVSSWISERRANNRVEEISAIRRVFGSESFLSKTT